MKLLKTENRMELIDTEKKPATPPPTMRTLPLEEFLAELNVNDELAPSVCQICFGSGMETVPPRGARPCQCVRDGQRARLIAKIPERNRCFNIPKLADLKPFLPEEHMRQSSEIKRKILDWQEAIIAHVQEHPFRSLNLCGKNKIGKSQIAFSILLNAFDSRRNVKFFKMAELLADYVTAAKQSFSPGVSSEEAYSLTFTPRLTVRELDGESGRYTIVIDEFHNWIMSSTKPQIRTVFEVLDAIKANRHQLIILSNYPFDWLRRGLYARRKEMGEEVEFLADSIISRINEEADMDELFF